MRHVTLVHYDEIALKGDNRVYFEQKLANNILEKCKNSHLTQYGVRRLFGRMIVENSIQTEQKMSETESEKLLSQVLSTTFGIAFFAPALLVENNMADIEKAALVMAKNEQFDSFGISTRRSVKTVPFDSKQVNIEVGSAVQSQTGKKVNLDAPDLKINIDITQDGTFIYTRRIAGLGGLPTGIQGSALILISGGIDSPVASFMMQKRGITPTYLHFHSYPFTSDASIDKVKRLVRTLDRYSGPSQLYLHPFSELQKKIVYAVPDKYRIIVYRRMMMRIAEKLAQKIGAKALITGEALGQVASQTLENISVIQSAIDMPILRPLIGFDKKEIVKKAEQIGTFAISAEPHDDCCTLFMPKKPATRARLDDILEVEKRLPVDELVLHALSTIEIELTDTSV